METGAGPLKSSLYEKKVDEILVQKKMESKLSVFAKFNGCNAVSTT
jgi:hypothetical protein